MEDLKRDMAMKNLTKIRGIFLAFFDLTTGKTMKDRNELTEYFFNSESEMTIL